MGRVGTPLTDVRALAGSIVLHALMLGLLSLIAARLAAPVPPPTSRAIRGELGPVDNRIPSAAEPGGRPGVPGTMATNETVRIAPGDRPPEVGPLADLLRDALGPSEPLEDLGPGSLSAGLAASSEQPLHPGHNAGGVGTGFGMGTGPGALQGTVFFGAEEYARSFAFVIDASGSMAQYKALDRAKAELLASLGRLPPDAEFAVIFYNLETTPLLDRDGRPGLRPATTANKDRVADQLRRVEAMGGTDHARALRAAFALRPEVIYFLTDAHHMTRETAEDLAEEAGPIRIQAIVFAVGPDPANTSPLKGLALATGGDYHYLDLLRFPPPTP